MSLIKYTTVSVDDALGVLSARSASPSTMGAQLEALEFGTRGTKVDPFQAQRNAENKILRDISALRCLDELADTRIRGEHMYSEQIQKLTTDRVNGRLVIQCLRAFEEWRNASHEKALAAVYMWAHGRAPKAYPIPKHREESLEQAFRTGKTPRARSKAADLYADCYLILAEWVPEWNRRQIHAVA